MLNLHRRDTPVLDFLNECNKSPLPKKILDCGAGGGHPPLAIFYNAGYETHGIEILDSQIERAEKFAQENNFSLNIIKGDMRKLPYENECFSFVFSHHTIFHMSKVEVGKAIKEMERVLVPGGLIFINFPSYECVGYGEGKELEKGEFLQMEFGEEVLHSYYEDREADMYFENFDFISIRKWILLKNEGWVDNMGMIEYIVKKKA
jgi:ubiquinone/menaquinone biosynthesis C-methylase UbiE